MDPLLYTPTGEKLKSERTEKKRRLDLKHHDLVRHLKEMDKKLWRPSSWTHRERDYAKIRCVFASWFYIKMLFYERFKTLQYWMPFQISKNDRHVPKVHLPHLHQSEWVPMSSLYFLTDNRKTSKQNENVEVYKIHCIRRKDNQNRLDNLSKKSI